MRVAAAVALALFVVGATLTWGTDLVVLGALVMVAGSIGLFVLVLLSASRNDAGDDELGGLEPVEDQSERLRARWP
jgi:hypothetical protein